EFRRVLFRSMAESRSGVGFHRGGLFGGGLLGGGLRRGLGLGGGGLFLGFFRGLFPGHAFDLVLGVVHQLFGGVLHLVEEGVVDGVEFLQFRLQFLPGGEVLLVQLLHFFLGLVVDGGAVLDGIGNVLGGGHFLEAVDA